MFIRVGKTESLGLWSKVLVYCFKLSYCKNALPMGQSFLQKYTMNLLKGPKEPILPILVSIYSENIFLSSPIACIACERLELLRTQIRVVVVL